MAGLEAGPARAVNRGCAGPFNVLDLLASGMTEDEILTDYPYLEKADFKAVYAYASHFGRDRLSRFDASP